MIWQKGRGGKLVVLMYHRVLPKESLDARYEQPGMIITPKSLDMHFAALLKHFEIVHLDDWIERSTGKKSLPKMACAVTFDDGWRDNFEFALPILESRQVPATIFLVSDLIDDPHEFWPNTVSRLIHIELSASGTSTLSVELLRHIGKSLSRAKRGEWSRQMAVDVAIDSLKELDDLEARDLLRPYTEQRARATVNREEISLMSQSGLIRFGSHGKTHRRLLAGTNTQDLHLEILGSRRDLQEICGQEINLFCYPNGDTSVAATEAVRASYSGAVTTEKGWVEPHVDLYQIPRIGVHEDIAQNEEAFLTRVSGWI